MAYNVNPAPTSGQGAFGLVPGQTPLPNPSADLASVYPNLSASTGALSSDIMGELQGQLSPATLNNLHNTAATYGVSSGMPGSNALLGSLPSNLNLESLGINTEQLQHQGIGDFLSGTQGVSGTQTVSPALQAEIASSNATLGAAPSPQLADQYALSLLQSPGGGVVTNSPFGGSNLLQPSGALPSFGQSPTQTFNNSDSQLLDQLINGNSVGGAGFNGNIDAETGLAMGGLGALESELYGYAGAGGGGFSGE